MPITISRTNVAMTITCAALCRIRDALADGIISEVEKNLDSIGYLEPVDISLQVISDNDKYSLSYDDLVRMDELIIQY